MRKRFCSKRRNGKILGHRNRNHLWESFAPFDSGDGSGEVTENPENQARSRAAIYVTVTGNGCNVGLGLQVNQAQWLGPHPQLRVSQFPSTGRFVLRCVLSQLMVKSYS